MGGLNMSLFSTTYGRMKILSMIAALVAIILAADYRRYSETDEEAFFWSLVTCLIIAVVLAVFSVAGLLDNPNGQNIDKIFYALAAILIIVTACFFIISVDDHKGGSDYARRAAAGAFGLLYGVLCAFIGWFF